ncbi:GOLPH3/VPS74 family protein [Bacillus sp. DJP31]|uniref:GOLPH3/VPS74 family protein n=1 Tax=Bacillus sp. DJP31 TaxID=3409789 RepID=UPI003BB80EBC
MMTHLAEELVLLSVNVETSKIPSSVATILPFAIAGAVLMELAVRGVTEEQCKKIFFRQQVSKDDVLFEEVRLAILKEKKEKSINHWVRVLGYVVQRNKMVYQLLDRYVEKGVLNKEQVPYLWVFKQTFYKASDRNGLLMEKRRQVRESIMSNDELSDRQIYLISLIEVSKLIPSLFSKEELKMAQARVQEFKSHPVYKKAIFSSSASSNDDGMAGILAAVYISGESNSGSDSGFDGGDGGGGGD